MTDQTQFQAVPETLTEDEKKALDQARMKRELALANAKAALAQNEAAEAQYNTVLLRIYLNHKMSENDEISEQGQIIRK